MQRLPGVIDGIFQRPPPLVADIVHDPDPRLVELVQGCGQDFAILQFVADDDFGRRRVIRIVLHDEGFQQAAGVGIESGSIVERLIAERSAVADHE